VGGRSDVAAALIVVKTSRASSTVQDAVASNSQAELGRLGRIRIGCREALLILDAVYFELLEEICRFL